MPKIISQLIDFAYAPKNRPYLEQALYTYFEPIYEVTDTNDQHELVRVLGPKIFQQLHTCAMEFFFSNDYDEDDGGYWNLIDRFIATKPLGLTEEDRQYLKGSRRSLMSVYEVLEVVPEQSITVRDLVRGGKPVVVYEKAATRSLVKWDKMALRVVDMGDHYVMAGGGLMLGNEATEYALEAIEHHQSLSEFVMPMLMGEKINDEFFEHIRQSLWAVEIGEAYVTALLEQRIRAASDPAPMFCNTEGHKIVDCKLTFPLTGDKKDIITRIVAIPHIEEDEAQKGTYAWAWLSPPEPMQPVREKGKPRNTKAVSKKPQPHDNARYTLRGRLILEKDALRIEANSTERAKIMEAMVQEHLQGLVGKPNWEMTAQEVMMGIKGGGGRRKSKPSRIPEPMQDDRLIAALTHDHYQKWLDMDIPMLNGKTPRQAVRSKAGRKKLVELLKYMENMEHRQSRASGQKPYDFTWLWKELGIAEALEAA